jgi:probable DNA repair protein
VSGEAISKAGLFARLAEGHAARITVVTPNRRLAQSLRAEFDAFQAAKGLSVWEDADILPLEGFVARGYEEALYTDAGAGLPMLLSEAQSLALWEQAIRASLWKDALLDVPRTAARAMDAWRLAHAWGIAEALLEGGSKFQAAEDAQAFAGWARLYARRLRKDGLIDAAQLPALRLPAPKTRQLVAYAFDIVPPRAQEIFSRFDCLRCVPGARQGRATRCEFASPREELEAAARWARARLEAGNGGGKPPRIGIVVPDLERRRREVVRVFSRVLRPEHGLPGAAPRALPFNVSLGEPLADFPIVAFALSLIEFSLGELAFERASRLIRSPFLGGAGREMAARARLDARLRKEAPASLSLPRLIGMMDRDWRLRSVFESVYERAAQGKPRAPHACAEHFSALLEAAGFPGERTPDSAEHQARAKWNDVLGELSRLGLVTSETSSQGALRSLRRLCERTLFQPARLPDGPDAPIQVLGLLESAGLEFDALWVSGLTDEAWPLAVRADPFLPIALQKRAGVPEASAETSLALDRRITGGWLRAAGEVVFSWPRQEADRALAPSPLIAEVPEARPELPPFASWRDAIFGASKIEARADEGAPPLPAKAVKGGTRVLADQAACPFRAFARWRLGAEALESPAPGPDAMARGQLLHALMAGIWRELGSSASLSGNLQGTIEKAAANAVKEQGLEGGFAELEAARLARLAREWLALERERAPFEVVAVEERRGIRIGGLELAGRIDRLDRFADGTHALIDYKTGSRATPKDWEGERPDDPQLPLYAVSATEPVSALAFARLRAGDMKFAGFSVKAEQLPGVKQAKSWQGLLEGWKASLENLAGEFARGHAPVDPKRGLQTCRNCDLQALCRVHERLSALGAGEEGGE